MQYERGAIIVLLYFLLGLAAILSIPLATADPINISTNSTYSFNYTAANTTNQSNITAYNASQDFFCEPRTGTTTEQITLDPGTTLTNTYTGTTKLNASCTAANDSDTSVCSFEEDLEPGDTFERDTAACDVEIDVDEAEEETDEEDDEDTVGKDVEIQVSKLGDDGEIIVQVQNRTRTLPSTGESFDYSFNSEVQCPAATIGENQVDNESIRDVYRDTFLRPTLETCQQYPEEFRNQTQQIMEQVRNQSQTLQKKTNRVGELQAENTRLETELNTTREDLSSAKNDAETKNVYLVLAVLFATFFVFSALANIYQASQRLGGIYG